MGGLVLAIPTEGFLLWSQRGCNGHPKPPGVFGGGNTGLDNGQPLRSRRRNRGRRKEMAVRRHDIVRSWHGLEWCPTVRRINHDGEKNEVSSGYPSSKLEIDTRRIEQSFYRSWVYSFLKFEDLEGMITDHGQISNGGLSNNNFSRTLIAQEILLLLLHLSYVK
jgi:hypothetical protein